ncbi:MAG: hypothetical protein CM15mP58_10750 [Burkholderiaceae bacterium]|nr:MAG: hypothetical protein CM15mP58_10750 [Burkholderiaceae bacterium]
MVQLTIIIETKFKNPFFEIAGEYHKQHLYLLVNLSLQDLSGSSKMKIPLGDFSRGEVYNSNILGSIELYLIFASRIYLTRR